MNLNIITAEDAKTLTDVAKAGTAERVATAKGKKQGEKAQVTEDDVYSRIMKYLPVPLVGVYLLLQNVVISNGSGNEKKVVAWALFGAFAVLVVLYLNSHNVSRQSQIVASVVAYAAWATVSPGPFQLIGGWKDWYGSIILGVAAAALLSINVKPLDQKALDKIAAKN